MRGLSVCALLLALSWQPALPQGLPTPQQDELEEVFPEETPAPRRHRVHRAAPTRPLDEMAAAASATYRPGPVLSQGPRDPILYRGPFVLKRTPILAEHKYPWHFGVSIRVIPRLRLYPFLAFDVYMDHGDRLRLLGTNFVYNSIEVPETTDFIEVPEMGGLGYVEVPHSNGTTDKFMILRLADNTLKATKLDEDGLGVYAAYCISGRVWARYAQRWVDMNEPVGMRILPEEWANPSEGPHLRKLLRGYTDYEFRGYWTLPERERLRRGWGEIWMPRDLRVVDSNGAGADTALPIHVGTFDVLFEEALTYTPGGYTTNLGGYNFPLFFPMEPGEGTIFGPGIQ
ncbi:MAG: hypothetical protein KBA64_03390 [Armatimonadetes bacterium]|jgi:hypothetical protein|nr:hypothetical protein [Armatimonadota bacterium]MDI9601259.1 hypothetical protein [Acidobacteriota bacterium]